jgi:hypothetical protein
MKNIIQLLNNHRHIILPMIIYIFPLLVSSQTTTSEINSIPKKFTHSFGLQFNNCMYDKGKFYDQTEKEFNLYPIYSYGSEFLFNYNLTHSSGFGLSIDLLAGDMAFGIKYIPYSNSFYRKINDITLGWDIFPPDYFGSNFKFSYRKKINEYLFIKPELGLKLAWYPTNYGGYKYYIASLTADTLLINMFVDNLKCDRKFYPDITTAINFLFHTKRNPRNNFVIGINANIGFTPRMKGYYTLYPHNRIDGKVNYYSTYLGFHIGYEFINFPKTFNRKVERKARSYEYFDSEKMIHSFGIFLNNGISLPTTLENAKGIVQPLFQTHYNPELNIKYNCTFQKGWGFSIEIPFGIFSRSAYSDLSGIVPSDTIWSNGSVGSELDMFGVSPVPYLGLSLKLSYLCKIHRNIFMQPELGIKFMPFIPKSDQFEKRWSFYIYDSGDTNYIRYLSCYLKIDEGLYFVPDLSTALNFYVHGKNPSHNFVFGLNANLCFVNRMAWTYHTTENLAGKYTSSGKFNWKTSYIGIHIGYQFMYGKKK